MSGRTVNLTITVADSATLSDVISVSDDAELGNYSLAGLESPDTVDGTEATIEYSRDDGTTWCKAYIGGTAEALTIASADGNDVLCFCPVAPAYHFAVGTKFRVRTTTDQTADRVFKLVFGLAVAK